MSGLRHRGEGNGWDVHGQPVAQAFGVKPPVCLQFVEDDVWVKWGADHVVWSKVQNPTRCECDRVCGAKVHSVCMHLRTHSLCVKCCVYYVRCALNIAFPVICDVFWILLSLLRISCTTLSSNIRMNMSFICVGCDRSKNWQSRSWQNVVIPRTHTHTRTDCTHSRVHPDVGGAKKHQKKQ